MCITHVPTNTFGKLYISDYKSTTDNTILKKLKINNIINMAKSLENKNFDNIIYYKYDIEDYLPVFLNTKKIMEENKKLCTILPNIVQLIHTKLIQGQNVLVHCKAGRQRSAAVILAYLMKYRKIKLEKAKEFLRNIRSETFNYGLYFTFEDCLTKYEKIIFI